MVCPFRVNTKFDYITIVSGKDEDDKKDSEPQYLESAQMQEFARCVEDECPFYGSWEQKCRRAESLVDIDD